MRRCRQVRTAALWVRVWVSDNEYTSIDRANGQPRLHDHLSYKSNETPRLALRKVGRAYSLQNDRMRSVPKKSCSSDVETRMIFRQVTYNRLQMASRRIASSAVGASARCVPSRSSAFAALRLPSGCPLQSTRTICSASKSDRRAKFERPRWCASGRSLTTECKFICLPDFMVLLCRASRS